MTDLSAEFKALAAQVEALKALVEQRMADRRELDALTVKHAALEKALQMADTLVSQLASQSAAAKARRSLVPVDATELVVMLDEEFAVRVTEGDDPSYMRNVNSLASFILKRQAAA